MWIRLHKRAVRKAGQTELVSTGDLALSLAGFFIFLCDPLQEDHHTMMVRAITCGEKMKFFNGRLARVSVNENATKTLEIPR